MIDTAPEAADFQAAGYRAMTPAQKLACVFELNATLEALAAVRLRQQYGPGLGERELKLRLAALRLDRDIMRRVFDWDPQREGY